MCRTIAWALALRAVGQGARTGAEFDRAEGVILAAASMGPIPVSFFEGRELPLRHHRFHHATKIFDDAVRNA